MVDATSSRFPNKDDFPLDKNHDSETSSILEQARFGNEQVSKSREFWKRVGFANAQDFSAHAI
jgi:hypothetical protein